MAEGREPLLFYLKSKAQRCWTYIEHNNLNSTGCRKNVDSLHLLNNFDQNIRTLIYMYVNIQPRLETPLRRAYIISNIQIQHFKRTRWDVNFISDNVANLNNKVHVTLFFITGNWCIRTYHNLIIYFGWQMDMLTYWKTCWNKTHWIALCR